VKMKNYKYLLENDIGEVFFIVGAEFAGPPLVSPDKFNALSVRYVKDIVDLIREYGKKSIVHYHGNLYHVLKGMKEINPDGLHTIEAPPIGDCTIAQAREVLGNMILIGNLQYDDLRSMTTDEIDEAVKNIIEEANSYNADYLVLEVNRPYLDNDQSFLVDYFKVYRWGIVNFGCFNNIEEGMQVAIRGHLINNNQETIVISEFIKVLYYPQKEVI